METAVEEPSAREAAGRHAEESKDIAPSVNFIAGGLVAAMSKVMVYPMETKVLLIAIGEGEAVDPRRLWHGVGVKGFENFLYNGLLWFLKELIRPLAPDPADPEKRPPVTFFGAFCVSSAAVMLAHPFSNVVVGMQASLRDVARRPLSALEVTKSLMKTQGLGGFFRSWPLSITLRLGSALTLVVYEFGRARIAGVLGGDLANFLAGLLGRLSEVYLVHPLKTLRSRQQQGQTLLPSVSPAAILRLWNGVGLMAVADAAKIGIRFLLIERLRTLLQWLLVGRHKRPRAALPKAQVAEVSVGTVVPYVARGG